MECSLRQEEVYTVSYILDGLCYKLAGSQETSVEFILCELDSLQLPSRFDMCTLYSLGTCSRVVLSMCAWEWSA